jgi:autotransporter passenger strand-loop-strand repeat protein
MTTISGASDLTLSAGIVGPYEEIISGGTATVYFVGSYPNGTTYQASSAFSGSSVDGTVVAGGGYLFVYSGGTANDTTISSGGVVSVRNGTANNTTVNSGGFAWLFGNATGNTVNAGGSLTVGGTAVGITLNSGGTAAVYGVLELLGGSILNGQLTFSGGTAAIGPGYTITSDLFSGSAPIVVLAGGNAVNFSGSLTVYGNAAATYVSDGHWFLLASGGMATGTVVDGGEEEIDSGGTDTGAVVRWNGTSGYALQSVGSGGSAISATIDSGGVQRIDSGGEAIATIASGGEQDVDSGGFATGTVVTDGYLIVFSGGAAVNTAIYNGFYNVGGVIDGTTVGSGGELIVGNTGVANNTTVESGGLEEVDGTGFRTPQYGSAGNTTIQSGGILNMMGGHFTGNTTIMPGASVNVNYGGVYALGGAFAAGGTLSVGSVGAIAGGVGLGSGGTAIFNNIVVSSGVTIFAGGVVSNVRGVISGAVVNAGGTLIVSSGGRAYATMLQSGGTAILADASTTMDIAPGALGGVVEFGTSGSLGGLLYVESPTPPPGLVVSDFLPGDFIDLVALPFVSGGSAVLDGNNELHISMGSGSYLLQFDPSQNYSNYSFQLSTDYRSGTDMQVSAGPSLVVSPADKSETASLSLVEDPLGDITTPPTSGAIDFTDSGTTQSPTAQVTSESVTLTDYDGSTGQLTAAQISAFENALTMKTAVDGSNAGEVDWTYNPDGTALDFLAAGQTAQLTAQVQVTAVVSTQSQIRDSATVTVTVHGDPVDYWDASTASSGTWSTAADWTNGAPNPLTDVVIGETVNGVNYTASVTLDQNATVQSVAFDPDSLTLAPNTYLKVAGPAGNCVVGTGQINIGDGATLEVNSVDSGVSVNFIAGHGTLIIDDEAQSLFGQSYTISAGYGNYFITTGGGAETITISGGGTTTVVAGSGSQNLAVSGGGTLKTNIDFNGQASVGSGSTLELAGAPIGLALHPGPITFTETNDWLPRETLKVDGTTMPANVISGFDAGDLIDLAGVNYVSGGSAILQAQNTLHISEGGQSYDLRLNPSEDFTGFKFKLFSDGSAGTDIAFAAGFDVQAAPSISDLQWIWDHTNLALIGYYLAAPHQTLTGWMDTRATLVGPGGQGWSVAPIYVGAQDAYASIPPSSDQGVIDGEQAIDLVGTSGSTVRGTFWDGQGFEEGTTVYLDVEPHADGSTQSKNEQDYISSWCTTVEDDGAYTPGIYCGYTDISVIQRITSKLPFAVPLWVARYGPVAKDGTGPQEPPPGLVNLPAPAPSQSGVTNAIAWQYWGHPPGNLYDVSTGSGSVGVDLDSINWPTTAVAGQTLNVNSGQRVSGAVASIGSILNVLPGGTVVDTIVHGILNVLSGAFADPTRVYSGGTEYVAAGGTDNGALIFSGGIQLDYGTAGGVIAFTGGSQVIEAAGTASRTIILSGGTEIVSSGGTALSTTVSGGGTQVVSAGGSASGTIIASGGVEIVMARTLAGAGAAPLLAGGTALGPADSGAVLGPAESGGGSVVSSGQTLSITSGRVSSGITVLSGGTLDVLSGGTANGTAISGGSEVVLSGGAIAGTTSISGGTLALAAGAAGGAVSFAGGGTLQLAGSSAPAGLSIAGFGSGDVIDLTADLFGYGATVSSSGNTLQVIENGGTYNVPFTSIPAGGFTLGGDGATGTDIVPGSTTISSFIYVSSGQKPGAYGLTANSGQELIVQSGGTMGGYAAAIYSGAIEVIQGGGIDGGGVVDGSTIVGTQYVLASGIATPGVQPGGVVYDYGLVSGNSLFRASTTEYVESGGVDSATAFNAGAIQNVESGGTAINFSFGGFGAGTQNVYAGAVISMSSGSAIGYTQNVFSGAVVSGLTVGGGTQNVLCGGTALNMRIYGTGPAAAQNVYSGGTASGTRVSGTSTLTLYGGATATFTVGPGGTIQITSGYVLSGLVLSAYTGHQDSDVLNVLAGGTAVRTLTINSNPVVVSSGGLASATTVGGGGAQVVSAGGTAIGTIVSSGGQSEQLYGLGLNEKLFGGSEAVSSGGTSISATVAGGFFDELYIGSGGTAFYGTVSGGYIQADVGGFVSGTTVSSGGRIYVSGLADATIVSSGGSGYINPGGTISGATLQDAGILTLAAGAVVSGGVVFAGSAGHQNLLQIGGSAIPAGLVLSNFALGDVVDLTSVTFSSTGSITTSGSSLTISENGSSYVLAFNSAVSAAAFRLTSDGNGDTELIGANPNIVSSGQTRSITSGQVGSGIAVLSGGTLDVLSGGTSLIGTIFSGGSEVLSAGTDSGATVGFGGQLTVSSGGEVISAQIVSGTSGAFKSGGFFRRRDARSVGHQRRPRGSAVRRGDHGDHRERQRLCRQHQRGGARARGRHGIGHRSVRNRQDCGGRRRRGGQRRRRLLRQRQQRRRVPVGRKRARHHPQFERRAGCRAVGFRRHGVRDGRQQRRL